MKIRKEEACTWCEIELFGRGFDSLYLHKTFQPYKIKILEKKYYFIWQKNQNQENLVF